MMHFLLLEEDFFYFKETFLCDTERERDFFLNLNFPEYLCTIFSRDLNFVGRKEEELVSFYLIIHSQEDFLVVCVCVFVFQHIFFKF